MATEIDPSQPSGFIERLPFGRQLNSAYVETRKRREDPIENALYIAQILGDIAVSAISRPPLPESKPDPLLGLDLRLHESRLKHQQRLAVRDLALNLLAQTQTGGSIEGAALEFKHALHELGDVTPQQIFLSPEEGQELGDYFQLR